MRIASQVKIEAANIDTVVEAMDSSISNLNGEIEDVSATTEQLAASTEETAASTEQINSMTQQIDGAAKEIAIRAQDGATEAEEIHKRAAQTKEATVENRQKFRRCSEKSGEGWSRHLKRQRLWNRSACLLILSLRLPDRLICLH